MIATCTDVPRAILDENSAYLVEPGDAVALSGALIEAAASQQERIRRAQNAQALFVERYSEEKVVPVIIATYKQVIDQFRSGGPAAAG